MRLRAGELAVTRPAADTLLASADVLRELLRQARESEDGEGEGVPRFEEILEVLQAFARTGELAAFPQVEVPSRPHPADEVRFEVRFVPPRDLLRRGLD